mgnify:CR=1 FL=1
MGYRPTALGWPWRAYQVSGRFIGLILTRLGLVGQRFSICKKNEPNEVSEEWIQKKLHNTLKVDQSHER